MNEAVFRLAVIGDPVAHSKSPELHNGFLARMNLKGSYEAIRVTPETLAFELRRMAAAGYQGINVTTPLKEIVLDQLEDADPLVKQIGAANTLIATPRGWHGANTDGVGAVSLVKLALSGPQENQSDDIRNRRILILGTGPTARAACVALVDAGANVSLWNRTAKRAQALTDILPVTIWKPGDQIDVAFATVPPNPTLPADVEHALLLAPVLIDANYGVRATLGAALGRPVIDGSRMLAAQAEASFTRWLEAMSAF